VTIWRMRIACWINNIIDKRSEYVILIAFPQQQWLRERATMLNCSFIACSVFFVLSYIISYREWNEEIKRVVTYDMIYIFVNCNWVATRWL
jgi:hypothetical protein